MNRWISSVLAALAMTVSCATVRADAAANTRLVLAFYEAAINQRDAELALRFLGDRYIQHNPLAPDGATGVRGLIEMLKTKFPQGRSEIKRTIAEGELVMLHVHARGTPDDRGRAIVDIFRLENGKIVEHWDVAQDIPEKMPHNNGMF